jgi:hypothetical protein
VPNKPQAASAQAAGPSDRTLLAADGVAIKLDEEFARLIPPHSPEELKQLEANLLAAKKCREPLTIWKENGTLLDGYTRLSLFHKHGIPFTVDAVSLPGRQAAGQWIIDHQLGRRNLSPAARAYLRGKQYEAQKKDAPATRANQHTHQTTAQGGKNCHPPKTADKLARQDSVSERTVRNHFEFAQAVDQIVANCGEEPAT